MQAPIHRRALLAMAGALGAGPALAQSEAQRLAAATAAAAAAPDEPLQPGPFQASWESLGKYQTPDWFRDAKFGIWAHWGPQCEPEVGDWYAREMYLEGHGRYQHHTATYGHPSQFGFKDVIRRWKAEHWQPDELVALYKQAGARYFMAMANHHDNFDLFASRHQPWNATLIGPQRDLIGGWAAAARAQGLPFGVSVHAAHAWTWYEPAQGADREGPLAGKPYDGALRLEDGKGQWWEGLDPQDLYAQNHARSANADNRNAIHGQWNWGNGASIPTDAYCRKFLNRTVELLSRYRPELVYFDDTALPLWPISDAGLKIAAHLYNLHTNDRNATQAVLFGKILDEQQRRCMVWDIERGQSNAIEPLPWQTDTCLGGWHYDGRLLREHQYKSAATVVHMLIDIVSKNGNLLLNVPVDRTGRIDADERRVVGEIGAWMRVNGESIYGTRPWTRFGEGPSLAESAPLQGQGFNEGKGKPLGAQDLRFTAKGEVLYASVFGLPADRRVRITSLARKAHREVRRVDLLGGAQALSFKQDGDALVVQLPEGLAPSPAYVLKIV
ncbi:alpha-L-fucosidase [Roseateles sp. DJS-2-20]|uniref:alpha-L-fucosidase n=2 Tax=Roseateles paludis TaxID=3145238 RepID=A0ABV0G2L2_9BURK